MANRASPPIHTHDTKGMRRSLSSSPTCKNLHLPPFLHFLLWYHLQTGRASLMARRTSSGTSMLLEQQKGLKVEPKWLRKVYIYMYIYIYIYIYMYTYIYIYK